VIRGYTETGSQWVGLVRGPLWDRLKAGETVELPGHTDAKGGVYQPLMLRGGMHSSLAERLERGERVCFPEKPPNPHYCFFLRDDNAKLLQAVGEYFPEVLPGAPIEHVSEVEPV
jgi:hypothetical protein